MYESFGMAAPLVPLGLAPRGQWGLKFEQGAEPPWPPHFNHCKMSYFLSVLCTLAPFDVKSYQIRQYRATRH